MSLSWVNTFDNEGTGTVLSVDVTPSQFASRHWIGQVMILVATQNVISSESFRTWTLSSTAPWTDLGYVDATSSDGSKLRVQTWYRYATTNVRASEPPATLTLSSGFASSSDGLAWLQLTEVVDSATFTPLPLFFDSTADGSVAPVGSGPYTLTAPSYSMGSAVSTLWHHMIYGTAGSSSPPPTISVSSSEGFLTGSASTTGASPSFLLSYTAGKSVTGPGSQTMPTFGSNRDRNGVHRTIALRTTPALSGLRVGR